MDTTVFFLNLDIRNLSFQTRKPSVFTLFLPLVPPAPASSKWVFPANLCLGAHFGNSELPAFHGCPSSSSAAGLHTTPQGSTGAPRGRTAGHGWTQPDGPRRVA